MPGRGAPQVPAPAKGAGKGRLRVGVRGRVRDTVRVGVRVEVRKCIRASPYHHMYVRVVAVEQDPIPGQLPHVGRVTPTIKRVITPDGGVVKPKVVHQDGHKVRPRLAGGQGDERRLRRPHHRHTGCGPASCVRLV